MRFLIGIFFSVYSLNASATNTIFLSDVHGQQFEVDQRTLVEKYKEIVASSGYRAEEIHLNDDGSITFVYPYFKYLNEDALFIGGTHPKDPSITPESVKGGFKGICKLFGYSEFQAVFVGISRPANRFSDFMILLGENGKIAEVKPYWSEDTKIWWNSVRDLTCSNGPAQPSKRD